MLGAVFLCLLLSTSNAVNLRSSPSEEVCKPACAPNCPGSSRPGVPCIPPPPVGQYPFKTNTSWKVDLGERILATVTPTLTAKDCNGFQQFGDSTWCNKAMKSEPGKHAAGLSFGIENRDYWSEKMSNLYGLPTKLFDCYASDESSPPLAGRAPNGIGKGKCKADGPHCYETHYEAFHVCLGMKKEKHGEKQFDTVENALEGRGAFSTHVKMDVEGSEWAVLHKLLQEQDQLDKIRTLDMEVHFGFEPKEDDLFKGKNQREKLTLEVEVLEGLQKFFEPVGSSLEVYREGWHPEQKKPNSGEEPPVHLANGFPLPQFAVSYVNRRLVPRK